MIGILELDANGTVVSADEGFFALLGLRELHAPPFFLADAFHSIPPNEGLEDAIAAAVAFTNHYYKVENCHARHIDLNVSLIPKAPGRFILVLADTRQPEDVLHAELEYFRDIFATFSEELPAGLAIKQADGTLLYVNRYLRERFGADEWLGKDARGYMGGTRADSVMESERQTLESGPRVQRLVFPKNNGTATHFQVHRFPLHTRSGETYLGALTFDTTEMESMRTSTEDMLESERQHRELLQATLEAVWYVTLKQDVDSICRRTVEAVRERLGFDRAGVWLLSEAPGILRGTYGTDLDGNIISEHQHTWDSAEWGLYRDLIEGDSKYFVCEDFLTQFDQYFTQYQRDIMEGVQHTATIALKTGGVFVGLIMVDNKFTQRPITEDAVQHMALFAANVANALERAREMESRQALETQMLQAQKLESLGVLAGGIAHDFNNLLMGMMGNADLIKAVTPDETIGRYADVITQSAARAADLCRELLAYAGKGRFNVGLLDLSSTVREIMQLIRVSVSKKTDVVYDLHEHVPLIEADGTQVRQVIMNLITNAAESFEDRQGTITITTGAGWFATDQLRSAYAIEPAAAGRYAFVEVHDDGVGIPPEGLKRIFDPFYTTKFTGRGLGLAAVLGIVRAHKGVLFVDSDVGQGTHFKVLFPAATAAAMTVELPIHEEAVFRSNGSILLVDDEPHVRDVARQMLELIGYSVTEATNGREALEMFTTGDDPFAAVLLDLSMPEMDGQETFERLCTLDPGVRVILASGYSEHPLDEQMASDNLVGFVQKPFTAGTLVSVLKKL